MEKFIKLLNEYDEGGNWRKLHWKGLGCENHDTIGYKDKGLSCEQDEIIAYLISKKYGFIKWLVDNDKIDFSREGEYSTKSIEEFDGLLRDDEDGLIMILAISDTPIEDLIYYLR